MNADIQKVILRLGNEIKTCPMASLTHYNKHQKIDIQRLACVGFLVKGAVAIYRTSDDALTLVSKAPAIVGLPQMRSEHKAHYHRFTEDSDIWMLPIDEASRVFTDNNLWPMAFDLLTFLLHEYFKLETLISSKDNTSLIDKHLRQIWNLPAGQREKISVYQYILARCHISRSRIYQVIKTFENNKKIIMQRGKLKYYTESNE